jgi:hypothetical protein
MIKHSVDALVVKKPAAVQRMLKLMMPDTLEALCQAWAMRILEVAFHHGVWAANQAALRDWLLLVLGRPARDQRLEHQRHLAEASNEV